MQREDVERLEKLIKTLEDSATNAERMCELLQPEFDAFEARTGHNVYVVRDYVDHMNAAKRQRLEASAMRALLAERDALQGQLNDLRNGWANSVKAHAALLAERDAAFAAGQEEMRERAAEIAQGKHDLALKFLAQYLKDYEGNTDSLIIANEIRALAIKPRP